MGLALPRGYTGYGPTTRPEKFEILDPPLTRCVTFGKCLLLSDLFSRKQIRARGVVGVCVCVCVCVYTHVKCGVPVHVMRGRREDDHRGSPSFGLPITLIPNWVPPNSTPC